MIGGAAAPCAHRRGTDGAARRARLEAQTLSHLGLFEHDAERLDAARACYRRALALLHVTGDRRREAFARGLVELAREYGLDVDRADLAFDDDARRVAESATMAREARFLRSKGGRAAMTKLAEAFPTLRADLPGVRPWDPEALDAWLGRSSPAVTSGSRDAAAFVLGVWNGRVSWSVAFDAHRALGVWDRAHRAAFLAWASAPWWP